MKYVIAIVGLIMPFAILLIGMIRLKPNKPSDTSEGGWDPGYGA